MFIRQEVDASSMNGTDSFIIGFVQHFAKGFAEHLKGRVTWKSIEYGKNSVDMSEDK